MKGSVRGTALLAAALVLLPAAAASAVVVAPVQYAVDDPLVVAEGTSGSLDVAANDVYQNGFGIVISANPAHGQVTAVRPSVGWYAYTPDAGFSGSDSFQYRLTFEDGSTDVGTVRVTVTPRPTTTTTRTTTTTTTGRTTTTARTTTTTTRRRTTTTRPRRTSTTSTAPSVTTSPPGVPQAVDDTAAADFGAPVLVAVLANDRGPLVPGSVVVIRPPVHGTAAVNPDGTVTYTSTGDTTVFSDSFGYRVSDAGGRTSQATVTVRLREPDDLLHGKTSSVPGGTLRVDGRGCRDGDAVRLELDGVATAGTVAGPDGSFRLAVLAPDRLGRYRLRAVCPGHSLQSWLDVVQTTNERSATTPVVAAAVATVGAMLGFYLLTGFVLASPVNRRNEPRQGSR